MKSWPIIILSILLLAVKSDAGDDRFNLDSHFNKGTLRLEIDNDVIWNMDDNFTNGWSIQYHTVRYDTWDEAIAPTLCKWIGKHFPTLGDQESIVRFGQGIRQTIGFRVGWNMQEGFNSFPAPSGGGIFQAAHIPKPATASPHGVELVVGGRAMGLLYSVIYDGSIITGDDRQVERENFVFSGMLGLTYHYFDLFSVRLAVIKASDILVEESLPTPRPGQKKTAPDNSFGSVMIDFYF